MNGQRLPAASGSLSVSLACLSVCRLTVQKRALHYHWAMLITTAVAFLHKNPKSHSQWEIGEIRCRRPFLLTFTTENSSVMLSKPLVLASLGFMRNNDGSKIADEGFAFTFGFGSVVYWGTRCIKPNFFCQWPLHWFHIQSQHVWALWPGLLEFALTFLAYMIKENSGNKSI